jgi:hypothetical protein
MQFIVAFVLEWNSVVYDHVFVDVVFVKFTSLINETMLLCIDKNTVS